MASTLGVDNPFRYRGYYYDTETGLYYLESRYYNPELGRMMSAYSLSVLGMSKTTLNDKNLYNYCDGNPVGRVDESGNFWAGAIFGKMVSQCGEMEICDLMYWHIFSKRKRRWYN